MGVRGWEEVGGTAKPPAYTLYLKFEHLLHVST